MPRLMGLQDWGHCYSMGAVVDLKLVNFVRQRSGRDMLIGRLKNPLVVENGHIADT